MKNIYIVSLVVLLSFVSGQSVFADEGAIKIGVSFSSLTHAGESTIFGDPRESTFLTGFSAGIQYRFTLLESLSVQPEILYVQKGFQQKVAGAVDPVTQKIKLNYLEIPLILKFHLNKNVYFAAGHYFAFRISAKLRTLASTLSGDTLSSVTDLDTVKRHDNGWVAAFGLILDDESGAFIEFRYTRGVAGVFKEPGEIIQQNSSLSLSLGYGF